MSTARQKLLTKLRKYTKKDLRIIASHLGRRPQGLKPKSQMTKEELVKFIESYLNTSQLNKIIRKEGIQPAKRITPARRVSPRRVSPRAAAGLGAMTVKELRAYATQKKIPGRGKKGLKRAGLIRLIQKHGG